MVTNININRAHITCNETVRIEIDSISPFRLDSSLLSICLVYCLFWLLFCGFIICARSFCSAIWSAVNRFIVLSHLKQESQNDRWCMQKHELDFVFIFVLFCGKNSPIQNHCVHLHSYLWWIAKFNQRMVFGFCVSVFFSWVFTARLPNIIAIKQMIFCNKLNFNCKEKEEIDYQTNH